MQSEPDLAAADHRTAKSMVQQTPALGAVLTTKCVSVFAAVSVGCNFLSLLRITTLAILTATQSCYTDSDLVEGKKDLMDWR